MVIMSGFLREVLKGEEVQWFPASESVKAQRPRFQPRPRPVRGETLPPAVLFEGPLRREELTPERVRAIAYQPDPRRKPDEWQWAEFIGWANRHFLNLRLRSGPMIKHHYSPSCRYRTAAPGFAL